METVDFTSLSEVTKKKVINLIEKLIQVTNESEVNSKVIGRLTQQMKMKNKQIYQQQKIIEELELVTQELNFRNKQLESDSKAREKLLKKELKKFREFCRNHSSVQSLIDDYKSTLVAMEKSLQEIESTQNKCSVAKSDSATQVDNIASTDYESGYENILLSDLFFKKEIPESLLDYLCFVKPPEDD